MPGMKAVYILVQGHRQQHPFSIDMRRQRQLHQNTMHARVQVVLADGAHNFNLAGTLWQRCSVGSNANVSAGLLPHAHIRLTVFAAADNNDGQAPTDA